MPPEIRTLLIAAGVEPDDVMEWEVRGELEELPVIDIKMKPRCDRVRLEITVSLEDE